MGHEFGGTIFSSESKRNIAAASSWITAGGLNDSEYCLALTDEELQGQLAQLATEDPDWHAMVIDGLEDALEQLRDEG